MPPFLDRAWVVPLSNMTIVTHESKVLNTLSPDYIFSLSSSLFLNDTLLTLCCYHRYHDTIALFYNFSMQNHVHNQGFPNSCSAFFVWRHTLEHYNGKLSFKHVSILTVIMPLSFQIKHKIICGSFPIFSTTTLKRFSIFLCI